MASASAKLEEIEVRCRGEDKAEVELVELSYLDMSAAFMWAATAL